MKAIVAFSLGVTLSSCNKTEEDPMPAKVSTVTVTDMINSEAGTTFTDVDCLTVVAANQQGVVLEEGNAHIYAFKGEAHNLIPGDIVTVSGTTEKRNGLLQLGKGCTLTKTYHLNKFKQPKPEEFSGKEVDAYMSAPEIKYVTVSGTLKVSGNYANFEIEGTDNIGSLDYMTDEFKNNYNKHSLTISGWLFGSYKTYMYMVPVEVEDNGEWSETVPEGAIFFSSFDKEIAVQDSEKYGTTKGWPWLDQFDGWKNEKGSGVADVTYSFQQMSVRTNQSSKGSLSTYDGSGNNNIFFGGSTDQPNYFIIENIAVPTENLKLSFGAQYYSQGAANTFLKSDFQVTLSADGKIWSPAIDYDFNGVEDTKDGKWRLASADFTLPTGTKTLYIKFVAKSFSVNRLDDVLLSEGKGGQLIEFGKEVETPLSKISDVIKGEVDKAYKIEGIVVATHTKGFLVKDDSGIILTFKKKHGINVGEKVTVEGTVTEYGGFNQFGETSVVTVNGKETVTNPKAETFKAAQFEAYVKSPSIKFISYTGALQSTRDQNFQWHNNIVIEGTTVQGSLAYVDNTIFPDVTSTNDGLKFIVTGYAIGVTGSDTKYVSTMITSIEPVDKVSMPDEKSALTVAELNKKLVDCKSGDAIGSFVAVKGYVAANNEGGNMGSMISLIDNTGEANSGIIISGKAYTESTLPVGTKVILNLKNAKYTLSNGLPTITLSVLFTTDEKVNIKVPEINDSQLNDYMGQYVKVTDLTAPEDATTWYDAAKKGNTDFTGKNGNTVVCYVKSSAKFKDGKIAHKTASLKGVVEIYKNKLEVIPTSSADVADFTE